MEAASYSAAHKGKPSSLRLSARDFQLQLYTRATTRNTIAVLDTGCGKTFIAAMLIKDALITESQARQKPQRIHKLIFFVVDKVALAIQQAEFLQRTCPGRIGVLYGTCVAPKSKYR